MHVVSIKYSIAHSLTDTGKYNLMDDSKSNYKNINKIIIVTSQISSVTQSHSGTSGSNVMVQIEVKNFLCIMHRISLKDEFLVLT